MKMKVTKIGEKNVEMIGTEFDLDRSIINLYQVVNMQGLILAN